MTLSDKIRSRRQELGWSQSELARRIDISKTHVVRMENGQLPRMYYLPLLAKALGFPTVVKLLEGVKIDPRPDCVPVRNRSKSKAA